MKTQVIVDQGKPSTHTKINSPSPPGSAAQPVGTITGSFLMLETFLLPWLPAASCAFMIYSSITAIYQSNGDPGTIAFVAGSLSILGALYYCMHEFEKAVSQRAAAKKERLKLTIWLLAMALNTLFSYRVTTVIESTVFSIIIWSIAGVTTAVGCYLMFVSPQGASN